MSLESQCIAWRLPRLWRPARVAAASGHAHAADRVAAFCRSNHASNNASMLSSASK